MTIRVITHKHANMYLIGDERLFLFDCGWQDSLPAIKAAFKGYGVDFGQIAGVFASHFHPDHAGTLELFRRHGVTPLILERQMSHIGWLNEFFKHSKNDPRGDFAPLNASDVTPLTPEQARVALTSCGIDGEILYTPGHSDDGVTLIIGGAAFTGDLPPYETADVNPTVAGSWRKIIDCGVTRIYPAHGAEYEVRMNEIIRCPWGDGADELMREYHDRQWGKPCFDERTLFEMLVLEGAQAGLSWSCILHKRENYRAAFDDWDIAKIAAYDEGKVAELLQNSGIVRNKLKVNAAIVNAQTTLKIGSLRDYIWDYVDGKPIVNHWREQGEMPATSPLSDKISKDMKRLGFKFVGSTIIYSYLQAVGVVNDHIEACEFKHGTTGGE